MEPVEQDTEGVISEDEQTWREQYPPVKPEVLKGRRYGSDFLAALRTTLRHCGFDDSDIVTATIIIDAGRRADEENNPSSVRRFPCAAWLFELYYRRETFKGLNREEREKRESSYSRQWRRRWDSLHDAQCRAHLGFFIKDDPEKRPDKKPTPCIYTDRLTDVVNEVLVRARKLPDFKKYAISCFEQAAREVTKEFQAKYPKYAPDWVEPGPSSISPGDDNDREETDKTYFDVADRLAKRCIKRAEQMSEDERVAFFTKMVRRFQMQLAELPSPEDDGTNGGKKDTAPPESLGGHEKTQAAASAHFSSSLPVAVVKNTEENHKLLQFRADNSVRVVGAEIAPALEAQKLLEAFESVGVVEVKIVFISCVSSSGDYRCVGAEDVTVEHVRRRTDGYIKRSEKQTQSVCLRPKSPELRQGAAVCSNGALIQVDDCSLEVLGRLAPYSFVTVETSPGNYQAWLALPKGITEGERVLVRERLLRQLKDTGANGGAFNSVRLPGCLNAKEKYRDAQGHLPRVRVVDVAPSLMVAPSVLETAGLLAAPLPAKVTSIVTYNNSRIPTSEVDYQYYLSRSGNSDKSFDRSNADICYAMAMLRLGHPRHYIISRINDLSDKAKGRRDSYAEQTVDRARNFVSEDSGQYGSQRQQVRL
jgi:hypothetical protein